MSSLVELKELEALSKIVKKFLKYSLKDINFKYADLCPEEKRLCTKKEFERLVAWIKSD
jgi:hypothetical protein